MATDFSYGNKAIESSGPIKPSGKNQPLDPRTEVKLYADIETIPNPYVGMIITVLEDETNQNKMTDYKVLSLKANALGIANSVIDRVQRYVDYLGANGQGVDTNDFATKEELGLKADKTELHSHINKTVLDGITSTNVDNWNNKVDNVEGKTLTTNDYTNEEKQTVASLKVTVGDTSSGLVKDVKDLKTNGTVTDEQISTAVNNYLTEHPVSGTLTPEQTTAVNKVKNSVFINAEDTSDNVTASDTTKVVEIVQKEVSNFRIPSLTPLSYASNPIITKDIVNDYDSVTGTADPFITKKDGVYYCFFELATGNVRTSTLGYAYSYDAITWTYGSKLSGLETRCAFPNIKLDSNGEWYMIPDTSANLDVYKAVNFPSVWQKEYTLLNGKFADTDIIKIGDIYYMFTMEVGSNLNCYYNESGDWKNTSWVKHPQSPVLQSPGMRLAGNIIVNDDGSAVVPCQGTQTGQYGEKTTFYQFTNFSKTSISISNGVTALTGSKGMWDGVAIHQISTLKCNNGNLYVVDGLAPGGTEEYSIGIYTDGDKQEIATSDITVPSINTNDWNDVNLTEVIDSDYMINGSNIKIVSSGVYLVNIQVGADKFRVNNKGVPILKGIKNGTKILYLKKDDILTVQIYNSTNSLDSNYSSFIDVIKLS